MVRPDMPSRPLILAIAVYVALDLSNPFMPGAFLFDAEESVEGVHAERSRPHLIAAGGSAPAPRVQTDDVVAQPPRPPAPMGRRRFDAPRAAHIPAADPPPPTDDH